MSSLKFLSLLSSGKKKLLSALQVSAGAGDADKIVATGADGRLDSSLMPAGLMAEQINLTASENITGGMFVNFWDDSGTLKMRKADASNSRPAHGYVTANVLSAATGTAYYGNINNALSGMTKGEDIYLSDTPGLYTHTPDINTYAILQRLGVAKSATEAIIEIDDFTEL